MKVTITYQGVEVTLTEIEPILAELAAVEAEMSMLFEGFDGSNPARLRPHHERLVALHAQIVELDQAVVSWNRAVALENGPTQDANILSIWASYKAWRTAQDDADGEPSA